MLSGVTLPPVEVAEFHGTRNAGRARLAEAEDAMFMGLFVEVCGELDRRLRPVP